MELHIENQTGLEITHKPGSISNKDLVFSGLSYSIIRVLSSNLSARLRNCDHCKFVISALSGICEMINCESCTISSASNKILINSCKDLTLFIFSETEPVIKNSSNLKFAPFNIKFSSQDVCFMESQLNSYKDKWSEVHDLSRNELIHYELLDPKEFKEETFLFEHLGEPCNPVPRHVHYGGSLNYEIIPYSKLHSVAVERRDLPPSKKIIHSQNDLRKDIPYSRPLTMVDSEPTVCKDNFVKKKVVLRYFYLGMKGFTVVNNKSIIVCKEFIELSLKEFKIVLDEYYLKQFEFLLASFASVIGMMLCFLVMQVMRLTSEWVLGSVVCAVVVISTSELIILIVVFVRWNKIKEFYELQVKEFGRKKTEKFALANVEFVGNLEYAEVFISEIELNAGEIENHNKLKDVY